MPFPHIGRGFDDGPGSAEETYLQVLAVPGPQLTADDGELAVHAIPNEHAEKTGPEIKKISLLPGILTFEFFHFHLPALGGTQEDSI